MRPALLALATLLPGCVTTLTESPAAAPYRALGTEPFWSVTVADGRTLNGCGGAILAPERLAGTSWSIVEMDGAPVGGEAYHLHFTADRLSGQAGCNRFFGPYAEADGAIVPGSIAATRMACPEPRMAHERLMLELLGGPVRFDHPDGDTLRLSGPTGTIRLRRSI